MDQTNSAAPNVSLSPATTDTTVTNAVDTAQADASGNSAASAVIDVPTASTAAPDMPVTHAAPSVDPTPQVADPVPAQTLAEPLSSAASAGLDSTGAEQLQLLRKIDGDIGALTAKVEGIEQRAVRNGAIAGGVAGGVAGGIVATGIAFIRHKLGF